MDRSCSPTLRVVESIKGFHRLLLRIPSSCLMAELTTSLRYFGIRILGVCWLYRSGFSFCNWRRRCRLQKCADCVGRLIDSLLCRVGFLNERIFRGWIHFYFLLFMVKSYVDELNFFNYFIKKNYFFNDILLQSS